MHLIRSRAVATPIAALAAAAMLAACTDNSAGDDAAAGSKTASSADVVTVESTDTECALSAADAASGNLVFRVHNGGGQVTEFYLLNEDGVAIAGEVENIGPGLTRDLVLRARPGEYVTACKPGMTGDGIRGTFTVTEGDDATATEQYRGYVAQQADLLLTGTIAFADAVKAGNDDEARRLYAPTRVAWESIEPVAESFGDLDPRLDLREADLEDGQEWTGWHRLEKDLWPPAGFTPTAAAERAPLADQLVADTRDLVERIGEVEFTVDQLGNGAKELLDEVATGKVTGEEEAWSHTDLWDFQANIDGARLAYQSLRPILMVKDSDLASELDAQFDAAQAALDPYRRGDGFALYTELTADQVKALADAVDSLGEPLSKLTSAVVL